MKPLEFNNQKFVALAGKKQLVVAIIGSSALWGLCSLPATARTLDSSRDRPFADVLVQIQEAINNAEAYISQIVEEKLSPMSEAIGEDIQAAINEATGALGLPDPVQSRERIEKAVADADNAVYQSDRVNEIDRQITRASAASTLSQEGQQQTQEQIAATQQAITVTQQQAQLAREEVVTQNVLKRIAEQNAQMSEVLGALRTDSLQEAQRQELANTNLTNISRSIDGQNQAQASETVGAGLENLKITSRAKLF